jgi:hypothetical protein
VPAARRNLAGLGPEDGHSGGIRRERRLTETVVIGRSTAELPTAPTSFLCAQGGLSFKQTEVSTMPRRGFVKNRRQYEGLRRKGMSKRRAAKIRNAGKAGSR